MATADFEQVKDIVAKYGDKQTIGRMASMGMIEPTTAVLAGMMIDRIMQQNMAAQAPQTTVAQDVFMPPGPMMGGGMPPMPEQPQPMPPQPMQPQQPMQQPMQPQMMRAGGVATLPVPDQMYEYRGGGIVAFQSGGLTEAEKILARAREEIRQAQEAAVAEQRRRDEEAKAEERQRQAAHAARLAESERAAVRAREEGAAIIAREEDPQTQAAHAARLAESERAAARIRAENAAIEARLASSLPAAAPASATDDVEPPYDPTTGIPPQTPKEHAIYEAYLGRVPVRQDTAALDAQIRKLLQSPVAPPAPPAATTSRPAAAPAPRPAAPPPAAAPAPRPAAPPAAAPRPAAASNSGLAAAAARPVPAPEVPLGSSQDATGQAASQRLPTPAAAASNMGLAAAAASSAGLRTIEVRTANIKRLEAELAQMKKDGAAPSALARQQRRIDAEKAALNSSLAVINPDLAAIYTDPLQSSGIGALANVSQITGQTGAAPVQAGAKQTGAAPVQAGAAPVQAGAAPVQAGAAPVQAGAEITPVTAPDLGTPEQRYKIAEDAAKRLIPARTDGITTKTLEAVLQERNDSIRALGGDPDIFNKQAQELRAQREQLKLDRKDAANLRLLEAGLAIMGGQSPYAFVNIGKGASQAMQGFADDVKDLRKSRIELDKTERALQAAQTKFAMESTDAARAEVAALEKQKRDQQDKDDAKIVSLTQSLVQLEENALSREFQASIENLKARTGEGRIQAIKEQAEARVLVEQARLAQAAEEFQKKFQAESDRRTDAAWNRAVDLVIARTSTGGDLQARYLQLQREDRKNKAAGEPTTLAEDFRYSEIVKAYGSPPPRPSGDTAPAQQSNKTVTFPNGSTYTFPTAEAAARARAAIASQ